MWQTIKDKKNVIIPATLIFVAALAAVGWWLEGPGFVLRDKVELPLIEMKGSSLQVTPQVLVPDPGGNISLRISLPAENGLSAEQVNVQYDALPVKMTEIIMTEYLKRLKNDMKNTKLLGVYRDRENVLYIDLSDEFSRNFPGGAKQEYYLLKSLYETIIGNIAGIADVKLLIEGKETESIGGHFYCLNGLKEIIVN